jgi:hypothetical protein
MFASPFVTDLKPGHVDGVYSMCKDPGSLERFASGSGDGVVKICIGSIFVYMKFDTNKLARGSSV